MKVPFSYIVDLRAAWAVPDPVKSKDQQSVSVGQGTCHRPDDLRRLPRTDMAEGES